MRGEALHQAAARMRLENSPGDPFTDTLLAVADWLDEVDPEGHHPDEMCCAACEVAYAYLGGAS